MFVSSNFPPVIPKELWEFLLMGSIRSDGFGKLGNTFFTI